MDKPLNINNKNGDSDQTNAKDGNTTTSQSGNGSALPDVKPAQEASQTTSSPALPATIDPAAVANSPETIQQAELAKKILEDAAADKKSLPWMNDPKRRLAIRVFSRGVLGAAFFAAGGAVERKWMQGYNPDAGFGNQRNPFTFVAKLIDTVVGVPIETTVKAVTGDAMFAQKSVLFRPTYRPGVSTVDGERVWGRSLGAEVMGVTFDFFCASVGDAWGRDIAGFFDPNVKKAWKDEKGNVNIPQAIQKSLNAVTRYVTYNGGEDWFVAVPYVYFMRGQRKLINHFSPGFRYDSDQGKFGNSFKIGGSPKNLDGTINYNYHPQITGNYALEGMLDLQTRFTVYNIGTLMYRELYDYVTNKWQGKNDHLYGDPTRTDDQKKGPLETIGYLAKWAARSTVKGVINMTPSVPFFHVFRSTQFRHRGLFIHPEHGEMTRVDHSYTDGSRNRPVEASEAYVFPKLRTEDVYFSRYDQSFVKKKGIPFERTGPMNGLTANPATWSSKTDPHYINTVTDAKFHPYKEGTGILDKTLNAVGGAQYSASRSLDGLAKFGDKHGGALSAKFRNALGITESRQFTRPFVRASIAYTPYMYAKAEASNLWDNGKMDMAAERLIDGATKLNWGEFKSGVGEVWNTVLHKPLSNPTREAEGNRRIMVDTSPPDIFRNEDYVEEKKLELQHIKKEEESAVQAKRIEEQMQKPQKLNWRERVIAARSEDRPEIGANKPKSYTEQEALRKALEELQPPTPSIN